MSNRQVLEFQFFFLLVCCSVVPILVYLFIFTDLWACPLPFCQKNYCKNLIIGTIFEKSLFLINSDLTKINKNLTWVRHFEFKNKARLTLDS